MTENKAKLDGSILYHAALLVPFTNCGYRCDAGIDVGKPDKVHEHESDQNINNTLTTTIYHAQQTVSPLWALQQGCRNPGGMGDIFPNNLTVSPPNF